MAFKQMWIKIVVMSLLCLASSMMYQVMASCTTQKCFDTTYVAYRDGGFQTWCVQWDEAPAEWGYSVDELAGVPDTFVLDVRYWPYTAKTGGCTTDCDYTPNPAPDGIHKVGKLNGTKQSEAFEDKFTECVQKGT